MVSHPARTLAPLRFVRQRGWLDVAEKRAFVDAGYMRGQLLEVVAWISLKTLTKLHEPLFPQRGIDRARFPKKKPRKRPITRGTTIPKKGKNPALALTGGDLVGVEHEGVWLAGVVLGVHDTGKTTLPVIELYAGTFDERPDPGSLKKARAHARVVGPCRVAPHWRREPLAFEGLELFGPVMPARLELLAHGQPPPDPRGAPATHHRVVAPRNLLYLLSALAAPSLPGR